MNHIILFDGECNFCHDSVRFIIDRDTKRIFKFSSLQSETGQQLLAKHQVQQDLSSVVLLKDGRMYTKSSAALRIARELKGWWKLFFVFIIVPAPIRNVFYDVVSKNRYKWFGKQESCNVPSPEMRNRFL